MKNVTIVDPLPDVLDGAYRAKWCGYEIVFEAQGAVKKVKTSIGVRGINIPRIVVVTNGRGIVVEPHGDLTK